MAVKFSNNASTTLASAVDTLSTSITVANASNFPTLGAGDYTYVTLDADTIPASREVVKVTAISGNVFTVVRGQDGTSATAFDAGVAVELRLTAALLNDVADLPLSVSTAAASGGGTLSYSAGVFTFAPADFSGYATETYVGVEIANLVDSAPATLDTLNELAAALGDDPNFATTVTNSIATKWTQDNTKISNWDTAYSWGDHSSAGYITDLSAFTTTDLTEGTNLYYTNERVDDRVNALIVPGLGITTSYDDTAGTLTIDSDTIEEVCKNGTGSTILKGTPVYQTGTAGNAMVIAPADASSAATMPAVGVLSQDLAAAAEGNLILMGRISGVDTSAFSEGDVIYVASGGGYTNVRPTGQSVLVQNLGRVTKVHASNGGGVVMGAGRSNDVPNLTNGNIFIGNAGGTYDKRAIVTADISDLTATATELNYTDGVTSNIQTQLDTKAPLASPTFTGTVTADGLSLGDNDKATFGAGNDLEIYHDGSNSYISDVGTGSLRILAQDFRVRTADNAGQIITGIDGGQVNLYYNSELQLATTATGIDVNGTATMDGLTVDGDGVVNGSFTISGAAEGLRLTETDTTDLNTYITNSGGDLLVRTANDAYSSFVSRIRLDHATGDISFYEDTGTTAQVVWDASADALTFGDNVKATFGASNDLEIYHDGSASFITDTGTGNLRVQGTNLALQNADGTKNYLLGVDGGATSVYFNNNIKLATTATGIDVTGTVTATSFSGDGSSLTGIDSLPSQTGNDGYYLTTDGTTASWAAVSGGGGSFAYVRSNYTATSGQTVFAATYTVGYVDVYVNGVKIISGTDFTATNGTSVTLSSGAAAGDLIEIIAFETFAVADALLAANNLSEVNPATARSNLGVPSTSEALLVANDLSDLSNAATARTNLGLVIGTDVQAYDADNTTATNTQTLTNKTLTDPVFDAGYTENVFALTGTTPALDASNGTIQTWTLSGNSTPTDGLSSGQSITLMVDDGTAYTITWPTMQWAGGSAPTLATSGYSVVTLWKVASTLYGASLGDMS